MEKTIEKYEQIKKLLRHLKITTSSLKKRVIKRLAVEPEKLLVKSKNL